MRPYIEGCIPCQPTFCEILSISRLKQSHRSIETNKKLAICQKENWIQFLKVKIIKSTILQ